MTEPSEWEAVFFDIGGVILDTESVRQAHRTFIERLVTTLDLDTTVDETLDAWREGVGQYFRSRDGTEFRSARDGYAVGVNEAVGESVPPETWWPLFEEATHEHATPIPGAIETITTLADTTLHLGIISDIDAAEAERLLGLFDIREAFDSVTTSEEAGRTKPHPLIFQTALRKSRVDPQRSLMVGDRYDHDMRGATHVGMHTAAYGDAADRAPDHAIDYVLTDLRDLLPILNLEPTHQND